MIIRLIVKSAIGLMAFAAVFIAVAGLKNLTLSKWHRRAGWLALDGLTLCSLLGPFAGIPTAFLLKPWYLHVILSLPCAVAVLSKIWAGQREGRWTKKQARSWCATAFVAGLGLFVFACVLVARRLSTPSMAQAREKVLGHQVAVWGHIALTFVLIWLGHVALKSWRIVS